MATLVFDFPEPVTGRPVRTVYRDPHRVVVAASIDEVPGALHEVERGVAAGLYAAGYLAYEAAPAFEPRMRVRPGNRLPLLWFGLFSGQGPDPDPDLPPIRPAHGVTASGIASPGVAVPGVTTSGGAAGGEAAATAGLDAADWRLEVDRARYDAAVAAVREAIADGLTYQVNLTARLRGSVAPGNGTDALALYESLRRAQGSGWHALLDLGRHVILSVSPELFFRTRGRRIETRPMKGTRGRGRWPAEDEALRTALAASEKDRAENLMIVDLLRNDLGRVCETGSIRVPRLFDVERYPTVWQLTSTVEGRLRPGTGLGQVLAALFPCGSVTGAPKISTMGLIAELESSPREVYCGAIGVVSPDGAAAFNVPIRTLWWDRSTGEAEYGTGGGVVWDSTAETEYDELVAKAVVIRDPWPEFRLVETLASKQGRVARLERHLARLRRSADYFGFPFPEDTIRAAIAGSPAEKAAGPGERAGRRGLREPVGREGATRIRVELDADGGVAVRREPLGDRGADDPSASSRPPLSVTLALTPVDPADRFLYHKTTHRGALDAHRQATPSAWDVLLWNERGQVTEFTRGNVVAELDGRLVTPPLAAGLLPGCLREELLEAGNVVEADLLVDDLPRAARLWFINSARGWIEVSLRAP